MPGSRFVAGLEPTPVVRSGQPRTHTRNCGIQSAHQSLITDVLQVPLPPVRDYLLKPPVEAVVLVRPGARDVAGFSLIWREGFAHMTDTICDTKLSFGRVEIRTGVGRRRRWTALEKGRIVAEALNAGVPVAEIARRHDMSSQHLFSWIRAAKEGRLALPADEVAVFVPIVTAATEVTKAPKAAPSTPIEIGIKDFVVRVVPGIDMGLLFDVLRAVKAAA